MKLYKGMKVSCKIKGDVISEGKIQVQDGRYYLCQNEIKGAGCVDKLGYKFSYVSDTIDGELYGDNITDIKIISPATLDDLYPGCEVSSKGHIYKVLARLEDIVFLRDFANKTFSVFMMTIDLLKYYKYEVSYPKPEKMITIDGKEYSEEFIKEVLEGYERDSGEENENISHKI